MGAQWPFIIPQPQSAWLILRISSAACAAAGKVLGLHPYPHGPWVSTVVLFPPLHMGLLLGFVPEAALKDLGLPQ